MRQRIISLMVVTMLVIARLATTVFAIASIKAVSGKPTRKLSGTTAYCVKKYNGDNKSDEIAITLISKRGGETIESWNATGKETDIPALSLQRKHIRLAWKQPLTGESKPKAPIVVNGL